ncbi:hypothetical protein CGCF415_v004489 [Colletotrichum fructicola]|uniref:Uncharacterized protein n=1 Tax=Colletotrichum fructicola (strain Nara gc5) TaxID=1213859 RepID=L2FB19_COLFN|nr:uncharacterized protein CGMCC3_g17374 [Colletotrichum fructicola]KAF4480564.1 hypothetical protein CGGC5_v011056 [Colletotrichum fructicola Nara gc5]KAE9566475.1 hypothetical protein CGMCC3_g17374 [Colletotrichum fructicola]KAF4412587.1 hypothetical protein CFRS1_v002708 [Colletotrichum fructicola]KAF4901167.1 hypothetical protein CGCFRS4_v002902 [Colletotrichum fructicola]KAF4911397.1 hypothetical protein CGCF415_v004489 [Colletotrichum fructicola]
MSLQSCGIACRLFSLMARSPLTSRLREQSGLVITRLPASIFHPPLWGPSAIVRALATTAPREAADSPISTLIQKLRNEVDTAQAQNRNLVERLQKADNANRRLSVKLEESDSERRIAQMRYEKMSERLTENNKTLERWQQRNVRFQEQLETEANRNPEKAKRDFERKCENNLKSYLKLAESKDAQIRELEGMKGTAWVVAALIKVVGGTIYIGIILRFILFAGLVIEEDVRKAKMENKNV